MLEKIENAYLGFLRVMVLIAATVALAVFALACSQGLPGLIGQFGSGGASSKPTAGSLADYIKDERPSAASTQPSDLATQAGPPVPQKVRDAAKLLGDYAATRRVPLDSSELVEVLTSKRELITEEQRSAYDDSLLALMQELAVSKGVPLDVDHINGLLNWHVAKFSEAVEAKALQKATDATKAAASLTVGAAALGSFFMIIFFFIFVKIERNLRLVKTREVES